MQEIFLELAIPWKLELDFSAIDLKKAFPSIVRSLVHSILRRIGAPEKLIKIIKMLHEDAMFHISYGGETSSPYKNRRGFKEG